MRAVLAAGTVLALLAAPALAEGKAGRWTTFLLDKVPPQQNIAAAYAGNETVVVQYSVAMRRYKSAAERSEAERMAISFLPREGQSSVEPFTWIAADGDMVRRIGDGLFALSAGNPIGNWYTDVKCRVELWPKLFCEDGSQRTMSAPNLATLILDGVEYTRPYRMVEDPPQPPAE